MLSQRVVLLMVLLFVAAPVQAECGEECEPEGERQESSDPEGGSEPQGNSTEEEYAQQNGGGEPLTVWGIVKLVTGEGGQKDCRVYKTSMQDPTKTQVDPDSCWT